MTQACTISQTDIRTYAQRAHANSLKMALKWSITERNCSTYNFMSTNCLPVLDHLSPGTFINRSSMITAAEWHAVFLYLLNPRSDWSSEHYSICTAALGAYINTDRTYETRFHAWSKCHVTMYVSVLSQTFLLRLVCVRARVHACAFA